MAFAKGNKLGGRTKGAVNKSTASVKAALTDAFEKMGGVKSLLAWGQSEPTEFYKLWAKMLPADIEGRFSFDGTIKLVGQTSWVVGDGDVSPTGGARENAPDNGGG